MEFPRCSLCGEVLEIYLCPCAGGKTYVYDEGRGEYVLYTDSTDNETIIKCGNGCMAEYPVDQNVINEIMENYLKEE